MLRDFDIEMTEGHSFELEPEIDPEEEAREEERCEAENAAFCARANALWFGHIPHRRRAVKPGSPGQEKSNVRPNTGRPAPLRGSEVAENETDHDQRTRLG
jgi:hypothetical protein